jgi:hypothetical protein
MALSYATLVAVALAAGTIAGCASTHDYLIAQGYPPAFADGYQHGCNSGHQAAGAISGNFHKDVPRYLREARYATGRDDGFRQCQAMQESSERQHGTKNGKTNTRRPGSAKRTGPGARPCTGPEPRIKKRSPGAPF